MQNTSSKLKFKWRNHPISVLQKNYIGSDAILKQKETGVRRTLAQFHLEGHDADTDPWPWGGEPIYCDGQFVGSTASATYGYLHNKPLCLGFVQDFTSDNISANFVINKEFVIDISGKRFKATANLHPAA